MYTLRSAPCHDSQIINQYDDSIRSTLQAILNVTLTDDGHQAKLPVKHGGLGVLSASDLALPAFLASVFGSAELSLKLLPSSLTQLGGTNDVTYKCDMDIWQSSTKKPTPDSSIAVNQKIWSHQPCSNGYRCWSGVVSCPNSGKPSSPYCDCSTIFWSVPAGHSNVFSWYLSWQQSVWLAQLVRALAAPTHVRSCVQEVRVRSPERTSLTLASIPSG